MRLIGSEIKTGTHSLPYNNKNKGMKRFFFLIIIQLILSQFGFSQTDKTFWFAVPEVTWRHNNNGGEPTFIRLSALDIDANVTVSMPAQPAFTPMSVFIPAGTTKTLDLTPYIRTGYVPGGNVGTENDNNIIESGLPGDEGVVENRGFLIESDNLITAYLERNNTNNPDIWALKGSNGLGKEFMVPSQDFFDNNSFSSPEALNAFDIVATEDGTTVWITPSNDLKGPGNWQAGNTYSVTLDRGESISCVATDEANTAHLGGSVVTSNKDISIIWKDDSVHSDESSCYDLMGDQLIPNRLAGLEYVVMRGQLGQDNNGNNSNPNREFAYVMALESNTQVTFTDINGSHTETINNPGEMYRELLNGDQIAAEASATINYLHIEADKPVIVFHITGFGCEMGAAVLPTIDGCTGSLDVSFMRSTSEPFFLTIMTKFARLNGFYIEIRDAANNPTSYPIPASWFTAVGATGWYYLDKNWNEFGQAQGGIPAVPQGRVSRVYNEVGVFHLGLINGGATSGCRYGYFSDFSENRGSAVVSDTDSDLASACYGDSVQLKVEGGITFDWTPKLFITDPNASNPIVYPPSGVQEYSVDVTRSCWPDTTMKVVVVVDPEVRSYFELGYSNLTNCSPLEVSFDNLSIGGVTYYWDFGDGTTSTLEDPPNKTYVNTSGVTETYTISLTVGGNNCYDYFERTITVYPSVTGEIIPPDTSVSGCHPFPYTFGATLNGNIDILYWDFGDGDVEYTNTNPTHTFNNLTYSDTTYLVELVSTDTTYGYCQDRDTMMVTVHDLVDAGFTVDKKQGCSPFPINVKNTSKGNVNYQWSFGANAAITGDENTDTDFLVTYTNDASAVNMVRDMQLVATNNDGCTDTAQVNNFNIYPEFETTISATPTQGCNPLTVNFEQTTTPAAANQFYWDMGNGSTSASDTAFSKTYSHFQNTDQTYQVELISESQYGCRDTATPVDIEVYAYVDAAFSVSDTSGCSPFTVTVENNTSANSVQDSLKWNLDGETETTSNNTPFNILYNNTTNSVITKTITLTNSNSNGCDVVYEKEITIYPEVTAAFSPDEPLICHNDTIHFTNNTQYASGDPIVAGDVSYHWDFDDGTSSTQAAPAHVFKNTENNGTTPQTFTVTLTATVNNCDFVTTQTVQVYPKVIPRIDADTANVCTPALINFGNSSSHATSYQWYLNDAQLQTTPTVKYLITNPNLNAISHPVVKLIASNDFCVDSVTKTLNAYPELQPAFTPDVDEGCAPLNVEFANGSSGGDLTYLWDFKDGEESSSEAITPLTHEFSNKSATMVTRNVELTITNAIGCSASATVPIDVFPEVAAGFTFTKTTECSPMIVILENNSLNGTRFEWDYGYNGLGTVVSNTNPLSPTFENTNANANQPSVYNIQLVTIDENHPKCRDSVTKPITIYPEVLANYAITDNETGCSPLETEFSNNSTGYKLTYIWDYKDGNTSTNNQSAHNHTFDNLSNSDKTYPVRLTAYDSLGCFDTFYDTVIAHPKVLADFTFQKNGSCTPYPVTFNYPDLALNGNKFTWDFGEGNNYIGTDKSEFEHTFDNTQPNTVANYSIQLQALDTLTGCEDTISKNIEVYPRLNPGFTPDVTEGCNPLNVAFTNNTTGLSNYGWDFGDGQSSNQNSPTHEFSHLNGESDVPFTVRLNATQQGTGCKKVIDTTITVYSYVLANFGIKKAYGSKGSKANIVGGCSPFEVQMTDSSITNSEWFWNFGDGGTSTVSQPAQRTYYNDDETEPLTNEKYTIRLEVTNQQGCTHDTSQVVEVYPRSVPDFDVQLEGCHPLTANFENLSVDDENSTYFWNLGDGSTTTEKELTYTFNNYSYYNDTVYTVQLKTTTQYYCSDSVSKDIRVYPKPLASFIPAINRGCHPFNTVLRDSSKGEGLTVHWDFDNGETKTTGPGTIQHPVYYNNNNSEEINTHNVELVVENSQGCTDTVINKLHVYPNVVVGFNYTPEGCSPLTNDFENTSNKATTVFHWNFGDENTSGAKHPTHTYVNNSGRDQTYFVQLIGESRYSCKDTLVQPVSIYPAPVTDFTIKEPVQVYPDTVFTIINKTNFGPWDYQWDFGDGNTSAVSDNSFAYRYTGWAPNSQDNTYEVVLTVASDQCQGKKSHTLKLLPPTPVIQILNNAPNGCLPYTVQFSIDQAYSNEFYWEFGDGATSTLAEPVHQFTEPGIYNVKLTVSGDGGSQFDYKAVVVHELPEPDFKFSPEFVMLPDQPVQFFNLTNKGKDYIWRFGDGGSSGDENPTHTYTEQGVYDVELIAYSKEGCVDSILYPQAVTVSGEGVIKFPNAFLPSNSSPSDGSYSIPDDESNVFHPVWQGVKEYELWIFNRWGEQLFYSDDVYVGWNGRYGNNGKYLEQDVYFWKAKGKYQNGVPFKIAGDVTLLRR